MSFSKSYGETDFRKRFIDDVGRTHQSQRLTSTTGVEMSKHKEKCSKFSSKERYDYLNQAESSNTGQHPDFPNEEGIDH